LIQANKWTKAIDCWMVYPCSSRLRMYLYGVENYTS